MKQYNKCPFCGQKNLITETICSNCQKTLNMIDDFEYFDLQIYLNTYDYYKILELCSHHPNSLLYQYFYNYACIMLNKEHNIDNLINKDYQIEHLDIVCNHIREHYLLYSNDFITLFFDKYNQKNKEDILNGINNINLEQEKVVEKDLREELFMKTALLPLNVKNKPLKHKKLYLLLLSLVLLIVFTLVTILTTEQGLRYEMLNFSLIIPSIFLSQCFNSIVIKHKNIVLSIVSFIFTYYLITYLITIPYHEISWESIYLHGQRILFTPFVLVKTFHERMN